MKKNIVHFTLLTVAGCIVAGLFIGLATKCEQKKEPLAEKTQAFDKQAYKDSLANAYDLRLAASLDSMANYYMHRADGRKAKKDSAKQKYVSVPDSECCAKAAQAAIYIPILEADNADKDSAVNSLLQSGSQKDRVIARHTANLNKCQELNRQWAAAAEKEKPTLFLSGGVNSFGYAAAGIGYIHKRAGFEINYLTDAHRHGVEARLIYGITR